MLFPRFSAGTLECNLAGDVRLSFTSMLCSVLEGNLAGPPVDSGEFLPKWLMAVRLEMFGQHSGDFLYKPLANEGEKAKDKEKERPKERER